MTIKTCPALAVYVKNYLRIAVKTRLGHGLTPQYAKEFYRLALIILSENLTVLAENFDIFICPSAAIDQSWATQQWPKHMVIPQIEVNNLGKRLNHTDKQIRALGYTRLCFIGSDAPTLPNEYILQALVSLTSYDAVLGPCQDGGFYLLGSCKPLPDLTAIPWSKTNTLDKTTALLQSYRYRISMLAKWYDIDTATDLPLLNHHLKTSVPAHAALKQWLNRLPIISIIIPTLNEKSIIVPLIKALQKLSPTPEIIIVDGGSEDNTVALCHKFSVKTLRSPVSNRALQMNSGAQAASGKILLFLHADCLLQQSAYSAMLNSMADATIAGGCFRYALSSSQKSWPEWLIETGVALRVKLFKAPYGDQGYFVRRDVFTRIGEYKALPLLEDVEWFRRLKATKKAIFLKARLITSARRIHQHGWIRSSLRNNLIIFLFLCGVCPHKLANFYYNKR